MFWKMAVSLILSAIEESFKNPEKRQKLRVVLLNIRNQIDALYPDDPNTLLAAAKH